jgi:hypothetical protein
MAISFPLSLSGCAECSRLLPSRLVGVPTKMRSRHRDGWRDARWKSRLRVDPVRLGRCKGGSGGRVAAAAVALWQQATQRAAADRYFDARCQSSHHSSLPAALASRIPTVLALSVRAARWMRDAKASKVHGRAESRRAH